VHEAVIAAGDKQTGATIHRVNENYDEGRILRRAVIDVRAGETAEALEARVKAEEIRLITEFLNSL
jgi:folate-dependent phosphoribosylglycinamide formyltransferase PurN